ncbi:MAG TPA: TIGR02996 domain-containing protein [Kofleriaceae bacterium]|nr:TIGR02996 domain-containing protein [Kofleriaceae bacterium]
MGLRGSLDIDASRAALERAAAAGDSIASAGRAASPDAMRREVAILDAVLAAWRTNHHPAIAELVDAAARRAGEQAPVRVAAAAAARQAQWIAVANQRRAIDLAWLFDQFPVSRGDFGMERIAALAEWPDDPRVVIGLLELCRLKPLVTQRRMWTRVFAQLNARLALHAVPVLRSLVPTAPATAFDRRLVTRLAAIVRAAETLPEQPAPDAEVFARVAAILDLRSERADKQTIEQLLREVWAAPRDDGPRQVLADSLAERGDPRGELIALQLARRTSDRLALRRERKLLDDHGRALLGPLEPVIVSNAVLAFERGFVARCEVNWRRLAGVPELMTHAAWSTVHEYRLDAAGERACDVWLDHMIALGARRI